MSICDGFLSELKHEMISTRQTLERTPLGDPAWKPHAKSMTIQQLASHVAEIPGWAEPTLMLPELNLPADYKPWLAADTAELLSVYDKNIASAFKALEGFPDGRMFEPWTLKFGGQPVFTMPRVATFRSFVMNHLIHHRAQLGVYLRLLDIPVPSVYGPSADEGQMGG